MGNVISKQRQGAVTILTIDHPPLNVMSQAVLRELDSLLDELRDDTETVCVVITGAGDRAFMAGADIKEFPSLIGKKGIKSQFMESHAVLNKLDDFPKPTIAVLNGLTFGGGCELALTCDLRIAEDHVQIGLPEIKLGLFPGGGGTQRLPRVIGEARAKEMMFTGDPIDAEKAKEIGLVNKVAPKGEGLQYGLKLAERISRFSLPALSRIKRSVDEGLGVSLKDGLEREAELFEEVFQTEDIKEGVQAFIEKRKPEFLHR
ncbi:enoyl-CoA hydratase [Bacillus sp. FJAT-42376]|uniref:enoyl-CoA hydratase n=1 Tax=Bacillus sp. FJAT-42376 TaxID=2014076 RepID=UPI000F4F1754|nr:enoyl-CoA hydratase [Bacillus sp. FJAT-42376]AZB44933.1 enoyl-CoA hydratase [Bacillus sp. FJAT-42376]